MNLESKLTPPEDDLFKSEGERKIAEFLDDYNIQYAYEQGVLVSDRHRNRIWYPDFFLPEMGVYIEFFGLAGNSDYDQGIQRKIHTYDSMGLDVIYVYPWNFTHNWQKYLIDEIEQICQRRLETLNRKKLRSNPAIPHPELHNYSPPPLYAIPTGTYR